MLNHNEELKLIRMNEVQAETVNWLWYPYIAFHKNTRHDHLFVNINPTTPFIN